MNLTTKIHKAIIKASILHLGQKRKAEGLPYIIHPFATAFILSNYTDNEDIIIAGLLHDVLEDVPNYSIKDLEKDFGKQVAQIVKELSENKDPNDSRKKQIATWQKRKEEYLKKLESDGFEALMICAADKIHNLHSIIESYKKQGESLWKKFNAPKDKKLWFYGEVLDILKERLKNNIVKELEKKYNETQRLIKL